MNFGPPHYLPVNFGAKWRIAVISIVQHRMICFIMCWLMGGICNWSSCQFQRKMCNLNSSITLRIWESSGGWSIGRMGNFLFIRYSTSTHCHCRSISVVSSSLRSSSESRSPNMSINKWCKMQCYDKLDIPSSCSYASYARSSYPPSS